MAQNSTPPSDAELEDTEVLSQTCCLTLIEKSKSKHTSSLAKLSYHVLKPPSKEKSLKKLHSKSFKLINISSKSPALHIKTTTSTIDQTSKIDTKMVEPSHLASSHVSSEKRSVLTQKCLSYKNKKIQQHNLVPEYSSEQILYLTPKKQEGASTQKNTPRGLDMSSSIDLPEIFINRAESFSSPTKENSLSLSPTKQKSFINLNISRSKKTLQLLYEQQSGRKIEIVESQHSQQSQIDLYSVVQDYDWHLNI